MTLWPISDEVTVQIKSDFYDATHNSLTNRSHVRVGLVQDTRFSIQDFGDYIDELRKRAAAMKADLDDPEAVKLTGRHQHLQSVQGWQARWQRSKLIILSALLPVLVFLIAFILFRCHGATH